MTSFTISLLVLLAAAGAALLALGLRGRRINNHPHCRRCRFDLSGNNIGVENAKCPECGAGLSGARAVRHGARRRRPRLIGAGAAAMAVVLCILAVAAWPIVAGYNWNTIKPAWLLETETREIATPRAVAAAGELAARAMAGSLNADRHGRLAQRGVEAFVGAELPAQPERNAWGNIVESAWERKLLENESLGRYIESRMIVSFTPRSEIRRGDPVPVSVEVYTTEGGENRLGMLIGVRIDRISLGGSTIHMNPDPGETIGIMSKPAEHNTGSMMRWTLEAEQAPEFGEHRVEVEYAIEVFTGFERPWGTSGYFEQPEPPVSTRNRRTESSVRITRPDEENLAAIEPDADSAAAMRNAIGTTRVSAAKNEDGMMLSCSITIKQLPLPIAGQVFVSAGDREWPLGGLGAHATPGAPPNSSRGYGVGAVVDEFDAEMVDVVIRPDPEVARRNLRMTRYWGEEIVIRDVPVVND